MRSSKAFSGRLGCRRRRGVDHGSRLRLRERRHDPRRAPPLEQHRDAKEAVAAKGRSAEAIASLVRKYGVGLWLNTAFAATSDLDAVERSLVEIFAEHGRRRIRPSRRVAARMDPMQYGERETSRWGAAIFSGAPGFTVIKTAPLMLLVEDPPLLRDLAIKLGTPVFQYDVHDGDSHRLVEVDASGCVERSGFLASEADDESWEPPRDGRVQIGFHVVKPPRCALRSADALLQTGRFDLVSIERAAAPAILSAFAGDHAEHADNMLTVKYLISHVRMPFDGARVVIGERYHGDQLS